MRASNSRRILYIRYAPILADYAYGLEDEKQKQETKRQIDGWKALTKNVMIWDYNINYNEYFWCFPNRSYLKANMKTFKQMGAYYVMKQGANNVTPIWQDELNAYISSKLFWDEEENVDELVREYVNLYFGLCAERVQSFIDEMENLYEELRKGDFHVEVSGQVSCQPYFNAEIYPLETLERHVKALEDGILEVEKSNLTQSEKDAYVKRVKSVLMTPLRMIIKNAQFYFGEPSLKYENKYWQTADSLGLKMSAEAIPMFMELAKDGETTYKIITGQNPTDEEKKAIELLQKHVFEKTGAKLSVHTEDAIYPGHFEHAIMIGKNLITKEFYPQGLNLFDCLYYVEAQGWCVFIDSDSDVVGEVQAFIDLCLRQGETEHSLEIRDCKRIGKR